MEVIGLVASIVGIIAAAGKVAEILDKVVPSLTRLQPNAIALASETASTKIVLSAIQALIFTQPGLIPKKRKDLISLDQLVLVLTDGVLIFSKLQGLVEELGHPTDVLKLRVKWGRKESELGALYARLCSFKSSIIVMLNILQCESDSEASRSMEQLFDMLQSVLKKNDNLARRLRNLENNILPSSDNLSTLSSASEASTVRPNRDTGDSQSTTRSKLKASSPDSSQVDSITRFAFEDDLDRSRPYKQVHHRNTMDFSFQSSMVRSHAWTALTALSEVTLSDISLITVIALPIDPEEITNPQHYGLQITRSSTARTPLQPSSRAYKKLKALAFTIRKQGLGLPPVRKESAPSPGLSAPQQGRMRVHHIVLLGAKLSGKTSIIEKFFNNTFSVSTDATIEDCFREFCTIDGKRCELEVIDTTGEEEENSVRERWVREGQAFMLVYNTSSRHSFRHLTKIHEELLVAKPNVEIPIILVGNHRLGAIREVMEEDGLHLATEFKCPFMEVNAPSGKNIERAFFDLVRQSRNLPERRTVQTHGDKNVLADKSASFTRPSQQLQVLSIAAPDPDDLASGRCIDKPEKADRSFPARDSLSLISVADGSLSVKVDNSGNEVPVIENPVRESLVIGLNDLSKGDSDQDKLGRIDWPWHLVD